MTAGAVVPIEKPVSVLQRNGIVAVGIDPLVADDNPAGNGADARCLGGRRAHGDRVWAVLRQPSPAIRKTLVRVSEINRISVPRCAGLWQAQLWNAIGNEQMLNLRPAALKFTIKLLFEHVVFFANSRGNIKAERQVGIR